MIFKNYKATLDGEPPTWYLLAGSDEEAAWSALELSKLLDFKLLDVTLHEHKEILPQQVEEGEGHPSGDVRATRVRRSDGTPAVGADQSEHSSSDEGN